MKKRTKVIFVLSSLVVLILSLTITCFAAYTNYPIPSNPTAPTLYGQYMSSGTGLTYTRVTGGSLGPLSRQNNRNSWYFATQHTNSGGSSTNPFEYTSLPFFEVKARYVEDVYPEIANPWVGGLGLYTASSYQRSADDNYLYFAPLGSVPTQNLWFSCYVTNRYENTYIDNYERSYDMRARCDFIIAFYDERDATKLHHLTNQFAYGENDHFYDDGVFTYGLINVGYMLVSPVHFQAEFLNEPELSYDVDDLKYLKVVSIGCQFISSNYQDASNFNFGISHFDEYVENQSYFKGMSNMGYDKGFSEGAKLDDFGAMSFVFSSITGVLALEIFDGFYLWTLLSICVSIPLFIWVLKLFSGG